MVSILPWRTRDSILRMMEKLTIPESRGMRPKKWEVEELRILEQYYPLEGAAVASRLPGRTPCAVKNIARLHGIKSGLLPTKWTPEELHRIHENSHLPLAEMTALFPERTQTAVRKALESERKRQHARAVPGQVPDKAAAKKAMPNPLLQSAHTTMPVNFNNQGLAWTAHDLAFVKTNYGVMETDPTRE